MPKPRKAKRPLLSRPTKKPLLITVVVLVLLVGGGLAYAQFNNSQSPIDDNTDTQDGDFINLDPPTEEELKETEANKKSIADTPPPPPPLSSDGKKQVTPIITYADRAEVRAYVSGVFEEGGTCTATATSGSQTRKMSSQGFADVNKTTCIPIKWSLGSGNWSVVVSYSSGSSQGKSEAWNVN